METTNRKDLEAAFAAIRDKRADLDLLWSYVNGPQPLKYSTARLTDYFQNINTHFELNWCSVIVNAVLDRLQITGFRTGVKATDDKLADLFDKLHIDIEADKAHNASLSTSQSYVIVWKNESGKILVYYNDPRLCHVFYDDSDPTQKTYAAKWFNRSDGKQEITLYYTDRIEHWVSNKEQTGTSIDKPSAFELEASESNTYGVIPVFELKSEGEIFKVLTIQDAINKLFADMMVSSDFATAPLRWYIGNADPGSIKNSPNLWAWFPAGDGQGQQSSVGQFEATGLNNYSVEMDNLANRMFIITRTPKHYLVSTGANISGEALLAMESPLLKKVQKRQNQFSAQWQDIAAFISQLDGTPVAPDEVSVVWARSESTQPYTEAQTMQLMVNTGIPLTTYLKRAGWTDAELKELEKDRATEEKARRTLAQGLLNSLRIQDAQTNIGDNENVIPE